MENKIEIVLNTTQIDRMVFVTCQNFECQFNTFKTKGAPHCLLKEVEFNEDGTCKRAKKSE